MFLLAISVIFLIAVVPASAVASSPDHRINAAIGDASWSARHGHAPTALTDSTTRIRVHLEYVSEHLERADTAHLGATQRARRADVLHHLRAYTAAGVFPERASGDGFEGRRPRFIDHRGVHCAVGELIRASGHAELASRVNDEHEFSYVPDIDTPGLSDWAEHHGFTTRELAMIQPSYGPPPSRETVVAEIEDSKEGIFWRCGREHEVQKRVRVRLRGTRSGDVSVRHGRLFGASAFEDCVLDELVRAQLGGGAWDEQPKAFRTLYTIDFPGFEELGQQYLDSLASSLGSSNCLPRPGAIPRSASLKSVAKDGELRVEVRTEPRNEEVEQCMAKRITDRYGDLVGGRVVFEASTDIELSPRVGARWLEQYTRSYSSGVLTECYTEDAPKSVELVVSAKEGDERFSVDVAGDDSAFAQCVEEGLADKLMESLRVSRELHDGSFEQFARIDGTASVRVEAKVESPKERDERNQRALEEMERERDKYH